MDNMQLRALQLVFLYSYSHKKKFEMYIATVWVTIITNFLNMNDKCYTLHSSAQLTYLYYKYESFIHLFTSSYGSLYDHPYTWSSNPYTSSFNPYTSSSNPYTSSSNPYTSSSNPYTSSSNPYTSSFNPYTSSSNPYTSSYNPYTSSSNVLTSFSLIHLYSHLILKRWSCSYAKI